MATLAIRTIESSLGKKGFTKKDGDHNFYVYYVDDRKTDIFTKTSHGKREIGDQLIGLMARQCRIKTSEFKKLVNCTISKEQYEVMLQEAGHI